MIVVPPPPAEPEVLGLTSFAEAQNMLRWNEVRGVYVDTRSSSWQPEEGAEYHYVPPIDIVGQEAGE
jgi:hypothetical protein